MTLHDHLNINKVAQFVPLLLTSEQKKQPTESYKTIFRIESNHTYFFKNMVTWWMNIVLRDVLHACNGKIPSSPSPSVFGL